MNLSPLRMDDAGDPVAQPFDEHLGPTDSAVPPEPETLPRRIPHLGHAMLLLSFTGLMLILTQGALLLMGKSPAVSKAGAITVQHPKLQLAAMAVTYLVTLAAAWFFFPVLWKRSFLSGLSWNGRAARTQAGKLMGLALILGGMVQIVSHFIQTPKSLPIGEFFASATDAWLITAFGTILAPLFEEICFRGFLLPAFAIAYDWLSLDRTPEARLRWQSTTTLTPAAFLFSGVVSSGLFALLHAQQVLHNLPALAILFAVSLVLTLVRVRTQSVAASTLVHGTYNFFVFFTVMIATGGYRHLDRM